MKSINEDNEDNSVIWTAHLTKDEYDFVSNVLDNCGKSKEDMFKLLSLFTIAKSADNQ